MARRNPFEESNPREPVKGVQIINTRKERIARILGPDGYVQEIVLGMSDSRPDDNGGYVDTELVNVVTDRAGNTLPSDLHSLEGISYSGLFINSGDDRASCTSWLHPPGRSRKILLGEDGRQTLNGAICNRCDFWLGTIYLGLAVLGIGVILGLWKGVGLF